jgi:hypothetical protein
MDVVLKNNEAAEKKAREEPLKNRAQGITES